MRRAHWMWSCAFLQKKHRRICGFSGVCRRQNRRSGSAGLHRRAVIMQPDLPEKKSAAGRCTMQAGHRAALREVKRRSRHLQTGRAEVYSSGRWMERRSHRSENGSRVHRSCISSGSGCRVRTAGCLRRFRTASVSAALRSKTV